MSIRTDLALECRELLNGEEPEGVESKYEEKNGIKITEIEIKNKNGEEKLGKPIGKYITAEIPSLIKSGTTNTETAQLMADLLYSVLPEKGPVFVAGLGNENITPDALGPKSAAAVLATRHINTKLSQSLGLGELRSTAVIAPGVLGQTGVETAEIIKSVVNTIKPCAVIAIDAFAAMKLSRLGCTVQMSDAGIVPGSGVGNSRSELNKNNLGIPVISIGIPTVVDAGTLVRDIMNDENADINSVEKSMIITPREIDTVIERAAKLIGLTINLALQKHLSAQEILMLTSED